MFSERPRSRALFYVGLGLLLSGLVIIVWTAVFPPSEVRLIPGTVVGGLLFFGIGAALAAWGYVRGHPG